jgi:hypothetical protein
MKKVYKHKTLARDVYLGRIEDDGKIYRNVEGPRKPDHYVGRVDLQTGKVYSAESGPEVLVGHVELDNGKVFLTRLNQTDYIGRVNEKGRIYHHKRMAFDQYLGKIKDMMSYAYGGAAFLMLVLPVFETELTKEGLTSDSKTQSTAKSERGHAR